MADHRLWRRASLDRRHFADPLRRRRIVIVEQRHDVDFALRSARCSRRRLGLRWRRRSRGGGYGYGTILLLHRNRWLSLHVRYGPFVRGRHLGRLHRLTMHAAHGLCVDGLGIRLRNRRGSPSWLWLPREGRRFHPRRHTARLGLELRVCLGVMERRFGLLLHTQRRPFHRPRRLALNKFQPLPLPGVARSTCLLCLCQ